MYYRDNSEDYNNEINNDSCDDYEEFFKETPYCRGQSSYLPQMYYPMIYFYPNMWDITKTDEENVEDLSRRNYDYGYRCKDCDHDHDHDHDHNHNHYHNCKACESYWNCMPMVDMPMHEIKSPASDEDLKCMYPKIYTRIHPMVKYQGDMMEASHGTMYCPSEDEMDHMCKEVCDNLEGNYRDHYDEDNQNDDSEEMRQRRRYNRRDGNRDLFKILFIRDLLRRRRRRFF